VLHNGILKYFRDQKSFASNQKWLGYLSCEGMEVTQSAGEGKVESAWCSAVQCGAVWCSVVQCRNDFCACRVRELNKYIHVNIRIHKHVYKKGVCFCSMHLYTYILICSYA